MTRVNKGWEALLDRTFSLTIKPCNCIISHSYKPNPAPGRRPASGTAEGASQLAIIKEKKTEVINRFKTHAKDTGSAPVQIAVLTEQINQLNTHFQIHKKDFHSRRGMLMLIGRRRRLLDYLQKQDPKKYEETINKLDLRK